MLSDMEAIFSTEKLAVRYTSRPEVNQDFLTFDVPNGWDDVKRVTNKVLTYEGRDFTFRGWNSDRNECFFSAPHGGTSPVATFKRRS